MAIYPEPTNLTKPYEYLYYNNMVTHGWFGNLILLAIFLVSFIISKGLGYTSDRAFSGASFITALIALFFRLSGFIGDFAMIVSFIFGGLGIVWLLKERG